MKTKLLIFIALCYFFNAHAQKELTTESVQRKIKVIGSAEKFIVPDEIFVDITIADRYKGKNLISMDKSEAELLQKLDSLGIDKSNIFIDDFYSKSKYVSKRQSNIVKTKKYTVKLSDFKKVEFLISSLKEGNFNNCEISRFSHSKILEYRKEVKVAAVVAAKEKARNLLKPLDANIGKVLFVEEQAYSRYTSPHANMAVSANSIESYITFKKIRLYFEILVIFEIIDK